MIFSVCCVHREREISYNTVWKHLAFEVAIFLFWLLSFCWPTVLCCLLGQHIYTRPFLIFISIFSKQSVPFVAVQV